MRIFAGAFLIIICVFGITVVKADDPPQYGPWGPAENLGSVVNSAYNEAGPSISKDGLSLYFGCTRGDGATFDIYVSHRASLNEPWGPPISLGPNINTAYNEQTPLISIDGHALYFMSDAPGGFGGADLYVSRRHNKRIDSCWQIPLNLGDGINTAYMETGPALFEDDETGTITLYFSAQRQVPSLPPGLYIFASTLQEDGTFGDAAFVEGLNDLGFLNWRPAIRKDGLEFFVDSMVGTPAGATGGDIWVYTRTSTAEPWADPINLGSAVNTMSSDLRPALSFDGTELYFHSNRAGGFGSNDLYVSRREKLKD